MFKLKDSPTFGGRGQGGGKKMESSIKKMILVIASIAGFLLLTALGWLLYINAQFSVYEDSQYKFSIKYPKTWKVIIHPKKTVAVVFLRPKDTALDTLQESFNVVVQPVPDNISTLEAFSAAIKRQMTGVFEKSIIIVQDKSVKWDWREGHQIVFEAAKPGNLKMVNAWVLRDSQAYILSFLGDMNKYGKDSFVVNKMIRSLKLQ
jgi:hypothetical protein